MTTGGSDGDGDGASWEFVRARSVLPGAVESAVGYRSTAVEASVHRGLPSASLTFILSIDGPVVTAESPLELASGTAPARRVLLSRLHLAPAFVEQPTHQAGIQLAVHPLAARRLFGFPAAELTDLAHDGIELLGDDAERLHDGVEAGGTWAERFGVVRSVLRERATRSERRRAPRAEVGAAWRMLARRRGAVRVSALASEVQLSSRHLATLFDHELGVSPKQVAMLMRFDHARERIGDAVRAGAGGAPVSTLAAIAQECGYSDQAHLVREFQRFAGCSPSAWVREEFRNIQAGGHLVGAESAHGDLD
jgi:AraC-like DNA-binding protein